MSNGKKKTDAKSAVDAFLADSDELLDEVPYDEALPGDETPDDVDPASLGVQISQYLGWAIDAGLISDEFAEECGLVLEQFRKRELLSREVLRSCCSDKLEAGHLDERGNAFTRSYYEPGWDHYYYEDLDQLFPDLSDFAYIEDTWENFEKVGKMIGKRFEQWSKEQP